MKDWLDRHVPPALRLVPPCPARRMKGAPQSAMVLAAGLGTRLRPLTERVPEAARPGVRPERCIDHVLDRLVAAGVRRIIVNLQYMADWSNATLPAAATWK